MEYDRLKEEILSRWEEILRQITSPAKQKVNNRDSYICPLCGHGEHGDGLTINPKSGKYSLKCFGCDYSGDIIELIGRVDHIDSFPDQLKRASSYLGIDTEERKLSSNKPAQKQAKTERKSKTAMDIHTDTHTQTHTEDYTQYIKEAHSRLDKALGYLSSRGISKETADRLGLGYEPQFKTTISDTKKYTSWEALIIPTSNTSYVARNLNPRAKIGDRYRNRGAAILYRARRALTEAQSPIYVVEGELDAISILEAGGEALGLGSTSNYQQLVELIEGGVRPTQPLVLALDNDDKGRPTSEKLAKELDRLKIEYYIYNPFGGCKDANEALIKDREALAEEVAQTPDQIAERAEAEKEEKLEAEREEYYSTESTYSHIDKFIDGIVESANTPATPTGFDLLDRALDGGFYEGLYIIGAITSLGKTTLALQIVDQIAKRGKDILIFSLEMSRTELMSKSISRLTLLEVLSEGLSTKLAKTARGITDGARYEELYSEEEKDLIVKAIHSYREDYSRHIFIHEGIGDIGVEEIRERIDKHRKLTGRTPIVLIDYLQILAPYNDRLSDKQNTDKAVLELKRISRDYKTTIIGISAFNRDNYLQPVNLSSFKESGAIEYSSDVLIGLQFEGMDYREGEADTARAKRIRELRKEQEAKGKQGQAQSIQLKILKNRNGTKGEVNMSFYPLFNYFAENLEASVIQPKSSRKKS